MAFKDVLVLLFERAKEKHGIRNQEEFATRHGISREHMNQFLTGNVAPPAKTIWEILEREGYKLGECIELPDSKLARDKYRDAFANLEIIVSSEDDERIRGIKINLKDIAAGAVAEKRKRRARDSPFGKKRHTL